MTVDPEYIKRLESAYLEIYTFASFGWAYLGADHIFSDEEKREAKDALEKIRKCH